MKRVKITIYVAILAAVLGCSKDNLEDVANYDGDATSGVVTLSATTSVANTKVAFTDDSGVISLEWESGDSFSVYESGGAWVADFTLESSEGVEGVFTSADAVMDSETQYVALFPARPSDTLTTHQAYLEYDFTSQQSQSGAALSHLNSACQMSGEFYLGESITFEHNMVVLTVTYTIPSDETLNSMLFTNGEKSYELSLTDMDGVSGDFSAYLMIDPTDAVSRELSMMISYSDDSVGAYYAVDSSVEYLSGYRYTFDTASSQLTSYTLISTPAELVAFIASPTTNAILTNDIDLDSQTITTPSSGGYALTFNGNNCTIKNLTYESSSNYAGLFRSVLAAGTVKNLTLQSPTISGTETVGAIAGNATGTVTNCSVVGGTIAATTGTTCGGIAGQISSTSTVSYCSFSGSVNASGRVGGIAGATYSGSSPTISNCTVSETSTITSTGAAAGGIAGYYTNGGTISDCEFLGSVSATMNVGGILGYGVTPTLSGCKSSGSVTSTTTTDYAYAGGIVGYINDATTIKACDNSSSVTATRLCVGGVLGGSLAASVPIIMGCSNSGTIQGGNRTAGIAGYTNAVIVACYNTGTLSPTTSASTVGGIIGYSDDSTPTLYVIGCYNTGVISNTGNNNGNIVGTVSKPGTSVVSCYYVGDAYDVTSGTAATDISYLNETALPIMNASIKESDYAEYIYQIGDPSDTALPTIVPLAL